MITTTFIINLSYNYVALVLTNEREDQPFYFVVYFMRSDVISVAMPLHLGVVLNVSRLQLSSIYDILMKLLPVLENSHSPNKQ